MAKTRGWNLELFSRDAVRLTKLRAPLTSGARQLGTAFASWRRVKPSQLSRELRQGDAPELQKRRWIVGLSLVGVAMAQIVSLYQVGIVKHLPDPPLDIFDSDRVDASDYAYKRFLVPDGFLMLSSYATTALLAGMGGEKRSQTHPLLALGMGAKIVVDLLSAAELAREEWNDNHKLCPYCQTATLASLASLWMAWPEMISAWKNWRGA